MKTLSRRCRNPSRDLDGLHELGVLYDSQEAKPQTSAVIVISC